MRASLVRRKLWGRRGHTGGGEEGKLGWSLVPGGDVFGAEMDL